MSVILELVKNSSNNIINCGMSKGQKDRLFDVRSELAEIRNSESIEESKRIS